MNGLTLKTTKAFTLPSGEFCKLPLDRRNCAMRTPRKTRGSWIKNWSGAVFGFDWHRDREFEPLFASRNGLGTVGRFRVSTRIEIHRAMKKRMGRLP